MRWKLLQLFALIVSAAFLGALTGAIGARVQVELVELYQRHFS